MATYVAGLAAPEDDAALRALLRENPMSGRIALTFEREPDFFAAASVEGEVHRPLVVREQESGRVVAMGSLSQHSAWIDGQVRRIGYLSQLRLSGEVRSNVGVLARGFAFFREMAKRDGIDFCITTIVSDNEAGRRFLASPKRGFPVYSQVGRLASLVIPLWGDFSLDSSLSVESGTDENLEEIALFLQEQLSAFQFAPVWRVEDLRSPHRCRGLRPADFLLVRREGRLLACGALWDQSSFKQTVVRGYTPALRVLRPAANLLAPLLGMVRLPAVGSHFRYAYLSHWAAREPLALRTLVNAACRKARAEGQSYVSMGVCHGNRHLDFMRENCKFLEYESTIFSVHWPDQVDLVTLPQATRVPHLEIAAL